MHIDRSNYELWLIDWLDGNLTSQQVDELKLYLEQNPDIRDEFNDLVQVNLVPEQISFPRKEPLKRSHSDIPESQFEYLCIASLENDLTDRQQDELLEIVNHYPERKKTFDLIQKTILARERKYYKYKSRLLKRTQSQKVIRLSITALSTAAAVSLIIIISSLVNRTTAVRLNSSSDNFVPDSLPKSPSAVIAAGRILKDNNAAHSEEKSYSRPDNIDKKVKTVNQINIPAAVADSIIRNPENQRMIVNKITIRPQVDLAEGITSDRIIAINPEFIIPEADNKRSKAGKFISKTFREKFLKEKTPPDTPLRGYEIAEAGVSGLNKLFGWQMVLDMKNDDNGQPGSVYFSSKILKLNAPVKKKEPQQ